jgi:PAS domain S-box-containing protein
MNPPNDTLFSSDLWEPALEKYAAATHVTVKLFNTNLRVVFGAINPTPLFQLFDCGGYDPGLFVECACQCLAQTRERPAVTVSKVHGLAVFGTSLVLDGKIVGAAVAGYVLVDFSQLSEIQRVAKDAHLDFGRLWRVAREQIPVSKQRLTTNGELLQVLGDALLRENSRTRQYGEVARQLQETAKDKDNAHRELQKTAAALREGEERLETELAATRQLQSASALLIEGGDSQAIYSKIVDAAVAIMGSDMATMQTVDENQDVLRLLASRGFGPEFDAIFQLLNADAKTTCVTAWMTGQRVVVPDVETWDAVAGTTTLQNLREAGVRAALSTPLYSRGGHVMGVITTHWRTPHMPTESSLRLLDILARQAADVLEQKKAETAIHASEQRYRTLFELGPIAVYSCDASGVIRDFNRRAVELWGREPRPGDTDERWCGSFKLHRPDGAFLPHEQCPMAGVLVGKIPEARDEEVQIEQPDGSRVTVIVNIRPLKDERGEILGAINCFVDITERKLVEEVRGRLAAIVEFSDDAMISKTLDGIITSWNKGAERLFGYTAKEAIGQKITLIVPPDRLSEESMILERLGRGERIEHFETLRMRKDGRMLDISLTISPVKDTAGRVVGASKVARDITERKRAEQALREAHDHLESLVALRTAAVRKLSSEMIRTQDEERRRISRELHDSVGQQLAHAKMSLEGLKRPGATEKETRALGHVADTLDQCLTETRTISYLLHPPLLDEVGFASAANWYVEGYSERSGIQVNFDSPPDLGRLSGAVELVLFRVLQESLTNVHRHAHGSSVDVRVQAGASEIELEVRDHGQGMPAELLERFKNNGGGGVGLNSMRERISELGGRFEIQSDSTGTRIRVAIPLSAALPQSAKAMRTSAD